MWTWNVSKQQHSPLATQPGQTAPHSEHKCFTLSMLHSHWLQQRLPQLPLPAFSFLPPPGPILLYFLQGHWAKSHLQNTEVLLQSSAYPPLLVWGYPVIITWHSEHYILWQSLQSNDNSHLNCSFHKVCKMIEQWEGQECLYAPPPKPNSEIWYQVTKCRSHHTN